MKNDRTSKIAVVIEAHKQWLEMLSDKEFGSYYKEYMGLTTRKNEYKK